MSPSDETTAAHWRWSVLVLDRLPQALAAVSLFALMAMTCIDVVGRYLLNAPLDGATELTRLMMAVIVFAVLPVVSWHEQHISVDLLDNVFPNGLVNLRQMAMNMVAAVALGAIAWRIWALAERTAEYGDTTEYLNIPLAPMMFFISLMSGVTALALLVNVVRYARGRGPLSPQRARLTH